MKKKIDCIFTILLLALGFVHMVSTPVFYETFDTDTLWFAGTGLGFLYLGFINLFRIKAAEVFLKRLCFLSNILGLVYCILIVIKLAEPQAYISLIVLLVLSILSIVDLRLIKRES